MTIIIGIDPHKASHTAVAIDHTEVVLDEFRLRACATQNDPNDARSVAIAALRNDRLGCVSGDDHPQVSKLLAKRHRDLARQKSQASCRLHAVLMELAPGGMAKEQYMVWTGGDGSCPGLTWFSGSVLR